MLLHMITLTPKVASIEFSADATEFHHIHHDIMEHSRYSLRARLQCTVLNVTSTTTWHKYTVLQTMKNVRHNWTLSKNSLNSVVVIKPHA